MSNSKNEITLNQGNQEVSLQVLLKLREKGNTFIMV